MQDGSLPATVPIRYAAGQIVLDVRLGDDEATQPMLVDSGAPTAISESLAAVHGGDPAGTVSTISIDGQGVSNPVIPLRGLRIGPAEFRDVGAVETAIDRADPLRCLADAGIISASSTSIRWRAIRTRMSPCPCRRPGTMASWSDRSSKVPRARLTSSSMHPSWPSTARTSQTPLSTTPAAPHRCLAPADLHDGRRRSSVRRGGRPRGGLLRLARGARPWLRRLIPIDWVRIKTNTQKAPAG